MALQWIGQCFNSKYLKLKKEVTKENWAFKIATKASFGVLVLCAAIEGIGGGQTFGAPIKCGDMEFSQVVDDGYNHGCAHLKNEELEHCADGGKGYIPDDKKDPTVNYDHFTWYYKWVVIELVLSAALCLIPWAFWSIAEGELMKTFYKPANKRAVDVLNKNEDDFKMAVEKEKCLFSSQFQGTRTTKKYYLMFLTCQVLVLLTLVLNIWITNWFLNGYFLWYGYEVIDFKTMPVLVKQHRTNPTCFLFPTRVNCHLARVGTGGGPNQQNDHCTIPKNTLNGSIYLFVWFWFALTFTIMVLQLVFEMCFLASAYLPCIRQFLVSQQIGPKSLTDEMKSYLKNCSFGDVFVLYQLGKNTHPTFFYEMLKQLSANTQEDEGQQMLPTENGTDSQTISFTLSETSV